MIKLKIITLVLFGLIVEFAFLTQAFSQQPSTLYPETQYVYKQWDNESGLTQNTVYDVLEDDQGFIWVATEVGLARFDGHVFKNINVSTYPDLNSDYFMDFRDMSRSSNGGIWAVSRNAVFEINNHSVNTHDFRDYLKDSRLICLSEDNNGVLWIGTDNGVLFSLEDGAVNQFERWTDEARGSIQVLEKTAGALFIGTSEGLFIRNDTSGSIIKLPDFNSWSIRALIQDSDGTIWAGTENQGIIRKSSDRTTQFTEEDGLPERFITSLDLGPNGKLWIGTISSGLYVLVDEEIRDGDRKGFLSNSVRSIYISEQNVMWVGTAGSGLKQMREADIYNLPDRLGLSDDIILPIYEHKKGDTWLGTAGNGIFRMKDGNLLRYTRDDGLASQIVLSIYGTDDFIYVGTTGGLNRFNLDTDHFDKHYTTSDGLSNNITQAIYQDSDGNIWIAANSGGIHLLENGVINTIRLPDALNNAIFFGFFEDQNNNFWVSSNGSGMLRIDNKRQVKHYSAEEGLPSNIVYSFYEDDEGTLWIGTKNGLVYFNDTLGVADKDNGLEFEEIYRIIDDDNGYLWLSGNYGLQRIALKQLQQFKQEERGDFQLAVRFFDSSDGMNNSEANGGIFPAGWKMQDGTIWFPTVKGVAVVTPQKFNELKGAPEAHIEAMRFSNKEFSPTQTIAVPAGVYSIEIDYSSIEFMNPASVNFRFRLKEVTDEWKNVEKRRTAYFTTLSPGTYTFEVMAELFGQYSEPAQFSFEVMPFFYQTLWFRLGVLLLLFGAGYIFKQLHSKYQEESKLKFLVDEKTKDLQHALDEKDILIKEVHHRVKNNLAIISALLELQKDSVESEELINAFYDSQSRIQSIASIHEQLYQLENFSKLDFKIVLENLLSNISDLYSSGKEISYKLDLVEVELNVNQAIPATLFANEVISNSFKHAFKDRNKGSLFISLREKDSRLILKISDDGVGLPDDFTKESSDSLGFQLMEILASQLNAELSLETDKGTCFILEFEKSDKKGSASSFI